MIFEELDIPEHAKEILIESGIKNLFPPQIEAIRAGALKGKNLLLASPTASGKTLIAELCAIKHVVEGLGKVLYLSPLRALANEKFHEFKKYQDLTKPNGKKIRVGISTGDFDRTEPWLVYCDIIIVTNEKADSLLRHKASWIDQLSLVTADEIHLLNDANRGPTLEVVLSRLIQTNPNVQLLALSATVNNHDEIAEWLNAIPITTNWRPIQLKEGVVREQVIRFNNGQFTQIESRDKDPGINLVLDNILKGGQVLIFASTRRTSVSIAKKAAPKIKKLLSKNIKNKLIRVAKSLSKAGEKTRLSKLLADLVEKGVVFHHAGLSHTHRKIIEEAFRDGIIKVIVATPTLAFGVNLPARMVIISSYKRYISGYGYYPITVLDYKQMAGRAGRPKYDLLGESLLISKTEEEQDYLFSSYVNAKPERIWSRLGVEKILRSHVLAAIASDYANSERGVYEFFGKTLYAFQYGLRGIKEIIATILQFLQEEKMIKFKDNNLRATSFGRRVSQLYVDPLSAIVIREGLNTKSTNLSNLSLLHIITHTPDIFPRIRCSTKEIGDVALFAENHRTEFMFEESYELKNLIGYEEFLDEVKTALVLLSWIDELSEDKIIEKFSVEPGDLYRLIQSGEWLLYATSELSSLLGHKDIQSRITELQQRLIKGVRSELLPLVVLRGIGRVRARILYDAGLRTIEDLKKASIDDLMKLPLISSSIARSVKEQTGGFYTQKEWNKQKTEKQLEQQSLVEFYE